MTTPQPGQRLTVAERQERGLKGTYFWVTCPDCAPGNIRAAHDAGALMSKTVRRCREHAQELNNAIHQYMIGKKRHE